MEEDISGRRNGDEQTLHWESVNGIYKEWWTAQDMWSLGLVQGEDMGVKQEKYVRLIKEKSEHLAEIRRLYKAGNGQLQTD